MEAPFSDADAVASFSDYQLALPRLGAGAFKVAYRGAHEGADLVLKVMKEPVPGGELEAPELPERFARELLGMRTIDCPHVVRVLQEPSIRQVGQTQHLWYIEPFYSGATLRQEIDSGGHGSELASKVLLHMLLAVKAMWDSPSRIVHRDIKPGNIIHDSNGNLVLLDLGIALHADLSAITETFMPSPRTPRYAAPEQFLQRRYATIDFRTDLYQVGMVAFEAATGRHPFWYPGIGESEYLRRMTSFTSAPFGVSGLPKESAVAITGSSDIRVVESAADQDHP